MSDNVPISTLADLTDRTVSGGTITASDFNSFINDVEARIANLNDALADLENHHAGTAAPTDNAVQGKLWYETDTYRLHLDPDGSGADQPLSRVESGGVGISAVSRAGNAAGTLITFTIPANTLRADGKIIKFTCWGTKSAANGAAVIEVRLASAAVSTFQIQSAALRWMVEFYLIRTGSNTQDWFYKAINTDDVAAGFHGASAQSAGSVRLDFGTGTLTDTATIAFDLRNDGTGNASDNIVQEEMIVEILN